MLLLEPGGGSSLARSQQISQRASGLLAASSYRMLTPPPPTHAFLHSNAIVGRLQAANVCSEKYRPECFFVQQLCAPRLASHGRRGN